MPILSLSLTLAALLTSCTGQSKDATIPHSADAFLHHRFGPSGAIAHVVIVIQENRSVDNLFNGFPGADTVASGEDSKGETVPLQPVSLTARYGVAHTHSTFVTEYANGAMNGFDLVERTCSKLFLQPNGCRKRALVPYAYVPRSEVQPYWTMAEQYAFGDEMFQTNQGPSFPAHQYLVSGTSTIADGSTLRASENPVSPAGKATGGCDSEAGSTVQVIDQSGNENQTVYPCFQRLSLMQEADAASISWRYYQATPRAGLWKAPDAILAIRYGHSYADV
ncbi:MAG: alkaline phosphatase family protein, partial [Candidatus Tumulicola sp.]